MINASVLADLRAVLPGDWAVRPAVGGMTAYAEHPSGVIVHEPRYEPTGERRYWYATIRGFPGPGTVRRTADGAVHRLVDGIMRAADTLGPFVAQR